MLTLPAPELAASDAPLALVRLKRRGPPPRGAPEVAGWVPWAGAASSVGVLVVDLWLRLA